MQPAHLTILAWTGLIFWVLGQMWFAQIVVYPMFSYVGEREYAKYHSFYTKRILFPVILPGFGSFLMPLIVWLYGPMVPTWMSVGNIACGVVGLLLTVYLLIPRHNRLDNGKDDKILKQLVQYNWPRTLAITGQALITNAMLFHVFGQQ